MLDDAESEFDVRNHVDIASYTIHVMMIYNQINALPGESRSEASMRRRAIQGLMKNADYSCIGHSMLISEKTLSATCADMDKIGDIGVEKHIPLVGARKGKALGGVLNGGTDSSKDDCRRYLRGICRNGSKCKYNHPPGKQRRIG